MNNKTALNEESRNSDTETISIDTSGMVDSSLFNIPSTLANPRIDDYIQNAIHYNYNMLKARMMNLAESTAQDTRQCNALKGLMKDFLNQAYYETMRSVDGALESQGLLGDVRSSHGSLDAKGLADFLVD